MIAICVTTALLTAPQILWARRPLGGRRMTHREQTLTPYDEHLRCTGIRLAERFLAERARAEILGRLRSLAGDAPGPSCSSKCS